MLTPCCELPLAGAATSIMFVATKHVFRRDKSMLAATKHLSRQIYVCREKIFLSRFLCLLRQKFVFVVVFVVTSILLSRQSKLVGIKNLSVQKCGSAYFCRDKRRVFFATNTYKHVFVATKIILVAAPANDCEQA